ncbi:MAG: hypothetical protein KGQ70_01855 [Alphaproteobacteria bacterium]|nr:hypothetical protein [Alphaproteobacteria bacterium]
MAAAARRNERKPKSLSDVFNQFARDTIAHFPEAKGRLLIHDTNESTTYGRERLARQSRRSQASVDAFLKKRTQDKNRQTYAETDNRLRLLFIMYDEPVNENEIGALPKKAEKDILFVLDHELAHLVVKDPPLAGENEQYKSSIREAVADAYALIRHYQRYGTKSAHKSAIVDPWARAGALTLNGDTVHFSTLMLEEILKRRDVIDFASLDPQQTAELARRFAVAYTPPASVVNSIFKKLKPVQMIYDDEPDANKWLKALARIALDPKNDPYTFRICKKILDGYLDGRTDMDGRSFSTQGVYWDDVRARLKEAEERHTREDILFNIPLTSSRSRTKRPRPPQP